MTKMHKTKNCFNPAFMREEIFCEHEGQCNLRTFLFLELKLLHMATGGGVLP